MSGRYLREGETLHQCDRPSRANYGDIWRCDCGRRWVAKPSGALGFVWRRRLLPWPRTPGPDVDGEAT